MRNTTLVTSYQSILSTQATGAGAHLTHVGTFRVYARFQAPATNTGTVTVALEWAIGDFRRPVHNKDIALDPAWEATWRLVDLGLVSIPAVLTGTQRWEGRILAKSTVVGDDIDIDYLLLVPVGTGSGVAQGVQQFEVPTTFTVRDEFDQAAGALVGKTAAVGGTWATGITTSATDFSVEATGHTITRTASDSANRADVLGSALTAYFAQVDFKVAGISPKIGQVGRLVDASNHLLVYFDTGPTPATLNVVKTIAGTPTTLSSSATYYVTDALWYTMRVLVDAAGRITVWMFPQGGVPTGPLWQGQDSTLATGGTLASGKPGPFSNILNGQTTSHDNFYAATAITDAAMFASQSLEVRYDGVIREDSAGAFWQPVSSRVGDNLFVPPTGREQRSVRFIVKECRNDPLIGPDSAIDDINATLAVTPRYLSVPAPT
jgi:hypothetical protein